MKPEESAGCHQALSCRWSLEMRLALLVICMSLLPSTSSLPRPSSFSFFGLCSVQYMKAEERASMYYTERKPKNKTGEAWEQGYMNSIYVTKAWGNL